MDDIEFSRDTPARPDPASREMVEAAIRGDRERAQEILNERNSSGADGMPAPLGEGEKVESLPEQTTRTVIEEARGWGAKGEELVREWGPEFGQNLGYARYGLQNINPTLVKAFDEALQNSADPGALMASATRYLGQVGRMVAHNTGVPISPVMEMENRTMTQPNSRATSQPSPPAGGIDRQVRALTRALHAAHARGDRDQAKDIDAQIKSILNQQYAGQPLVGRGGRTA